MPGSVMSDHPYGWLSLLPPLSAIVLAITTRRVVPSLLAGVFIGALVLAGGNPIAATVDAVDGHLWRTLTDEDKLSVFAFTMLMGAMVGVVNRAGGMRGLVHVVTPWAHNRRRGQLVAWCLGLFVFFDDYANTLLLGNTLRPLTDRLRISREKLAYLVDSTAAPVSGLALVSTWVAGEIGYVQDGLDKLPASQNWKAFDLFLHSIPYRFYVLWALAFVPMVAWMGRDLGPMLRAEQRSLRAPSWDASRGGQSHVASGDIPARWHNAVVPVLATVAAIVYLLYVSGSSAAQTASPNGAPTLMQVFGEADAYKSLLWGSLIGLLVAVAWIGPQGLLSGKQMFDAAGEGAQMMVPALVILGLASTLSAMTGNQPSGEDAVKASIADALAEAGVPTQDAAQRPFPYRAYRLYTGAYLGELLNDRVPIFLLPTIVFVLASAVAFATGTSWGTMGILMPLVIPLAYGVLTNAGWQPGPDQAIMLCSIGSVLAGAIFGDHCSPISDTTVLSSQASGCNHVAHVWTQLPYALLVGLVSIVFGTLPVGLGVSAWILQPLGIAALLILLRVLGRGVQEDLPRTPSPSAERSAE